MQDFEAPIGDAPFFTPWPVWGVPGILRGAAPSPHFTEYKAHVFHWIPPHIRAVVGAKDGETIEIPYPDFKIDHHKFARALAKVAFCHAVLKFGLHGFRRLVTPALILGRYPNVPYFVGSELIDPPLPTEKSIKHVVNLIETTAGRLRLLQASVRLYSNSGTALAGPPIYDVVVGALR